MEAAAAALDSARMKAVSASSVCEMACPAAEAISQPSRVIWTPAGHLAPAGPGWAPAALPSGGPCGEATERVQYRACEGQLALPLENHTDGS